MRNDVFDLTKIRSKNSNGVKTVWGDTSLKGIFKSVADEYEEERQSPEPNSNDIEQQKPVQNQQDGADQEINNQYEKQPDESGIIRRVKGAHLVFKRKNDSGGFDELWMFSYKSAFSNGNLKKTVEVKRAILAGTDIPVRDNVSQDGKQHAEQIIIGDACFLKITGLPQ